MPSILASLETSGELAVSDKTGKPRTYHKKKDLSFSQLPTVMSNVFFVTWSTEIYYIICYTWIDLPKRYTFVQLHHNCIVSLIEAKPVYAFS